jgi:SAM-dependent methyltransferase
MAAACGIGPGRRVVDGGAGTGKFTRLRVPTGADLVAVEPVAGMRAVLTGAVPGVEVLDGSAAAIPLDDASVDVATVAQAFHWFATTEAVDELARVIRPGGWLALIWNTRAPASAWTATIEAILDRHRGDAPKFRADEPRWLAPLRDSDRFDEVRSASFPHAVPMPPEAMAARIASTSYISALPDDERAAVLAEVLERWTPHGPPYLEDYVTDVFWCRRR